MKSFALLSLARNNLQILSKNGHRTIFFIYIFIYRVTKISMGHRSMYSIIQLADYTKLITKLLLIINYGQI